MNTPHFYPVGTAGQPWGDTERAAWRARQVVQRSHADDVVAALHALPEAFTIEQYGQLQAGADAYPLLLAMTRDWNPALPTALVTGGVHGYETSGVHGALQFLQERAQVYAGRVNLIVVPCVCPWGYERIQRWNHDAVDPNRSFRDGGLITESATLMAWVAARNDALLMHVDLHETTDSDAHEFDPALAARDGKAWVQETIPDGFYVIGNSENPEPAFQQALIAAVAPITHIAPPTRTASWSACRCSPMAWSGASRVRSAPAPGSPTRALPPPPRCTRTARAPPRRSAMRRRSRRCARGWILHCRHRRPDSFRDYS